MRRDDVEREGRLARTSFSTMFVVPTIALLTAFVATGCVDDGTPGAKNGQHLQGGSGTAGGSGAAGTSGYGEGKGVLLPNGCLLDAEASECSSSNEFACCFLIGAHFLWNRESNCWSAIPSLESQIQWCAMSTYVSDQCGGELEAEYCYERPGDGGIEVFRTATTKDGDLGEGWVSCADDTSHIYDATECP